MKKIFILTLLTLYTYADMRVQEVLGVDCLKSYKDIYLPAKNHKAFIYAREKDTDKDRCVWWFGVSSLDEAIKGSMKKCQTYMLNAECMLVDTEGVFKVKDGTFTPINPPDDTPLSKDEKEILVKKAKNFILGNCYPFFVDKYLTTLSWSGQKYQK